MCPSDRSRTSNLECSAILPSDFRPAFDLLDADKDGKISPDDLREFYARLSFSYSGTTVATEEDIGSMISVADSNKDGFVEYNDFEKVLYLVPSESQYQPPRGDKWVMQDMFRVMDRDGDGKVGFEDLKTYMGWAGFQASDDDVRAMIRLGGGDENHDGISFEGLLKILALDLAGK